MFLTDGEKAQLSTISKKLSDLRDFLDATRLNGESADAAYWYGYLVVVKQALGNFDNEVSFIATLMAKDFLTRRHDLPGLDASSKSQNASGLDIDQMTTSGERVIGEIKTTNPCGHGDFGSTQKKYVFDDFIKLAETNAQWKYFLVTEQRAFEIVRRRYLRKLPGVTVAVLPDALSDSHFTIAVPSEAAPLKNGRDKEVP